MDNLPKPHHDCHPFTLNSEGKLNDISDKLPVLEIPDKVPNFVSRSK